uniref:Uncharacterized protein n=1 Tax=Oryza sativa subsp. japonica TaxID=39947 RepID=Q6Z9U3_ORYSJ|nr:hypothetical protein [Oryza sativa Japonica Group]
MSRATPPWNAAHKAMIAHAWHDDGSCGSSGAAAIAAETTQTAPTTEARISGEVTRREKEQRGRGVVGSRRAIEFALKLNGESPALI